MKRAACVFALAMLSACSKQSEDKATPPVETSADKQIEKEAKSIEQAADEAAKLIEEDARQDTSIPQ